MKSPGLIGLVLVVSTAGLLSLFDASRDSATADEPIHVVAGMVQAQTGTWIVNVEHPPLAKQLYGWAAGLVGARDTPPLSYGDFFRSTRKALFLQRGAVPRDRVLLASRIVAIALFLALIVAAYFAASADASGLLAAALLAGQTAVFPHGHLANTDIPMALFVVLAVHLALVCGRTIPEPSGNLCARHAALAAVLALALATKASAIILLGLIPLLLATFAFTGPAPQRWRRLVLAAAVPIVAVAMLAFLLSFWMRNDPLHTPARLSAIYRLSASDGELLRGLEGFSRGLSRYAMTVLVVLRLSEAGRLTYFLGEVSPRPSAAFHLTAILVKSPLVWLLSVGAGAILVVRNGWRSRDARIRDGEAMTAAVFLFSGLFLLAASLPGPRIGVRHVFPTIALLTVSAAAVLGPTVVTRSRHALTALVLLGISPLLFGRSLGSNGILGAAITAFSRPPLAGSDLDWGQDLGRVADLLKRRGISAGDVAIAYFGGDLPSLRLPGALDLLEERGAGRRYLVVSRQYLYLGPEAVLYPGGREGVLLALADVRRPGATFLERAGDSMDLFDLGGGVGGAPSPDPASVTR